MARLLDPTWNLRVKNAKNNKKWTPKYSNLGPSGDHFGSFVSFKVRSETEPIFGTSKSGPKPQVFHSETYMSEF